VDFNTEGSYTQQDNSKTQFINGAVTLEGALLANSTLGQNNKQAIASAGANDWEVFTVGTDTYALIADYRNDSTGLISSYLYKWMSSSNCFGNGTSCANSTLGANSLQTIGTATGLSWHAFAVGTDTYAFIADQNNGTSYLTNSYLYKWMSGSSCFGNGTSCANSTLGANALQTVGTAGAVSWKTFAVGTDTYALVANQRNSSSNYLVNSYLYKYMSGSSCFGNGTSCATSTLGANALQTIATAGGSDWQTFTSGTDTYVVLANYYNGSSYLINSYLFKWMSGSSCIGNGTSCANSTLGANTVQSIGTAGARDWRIVTIGTDTYAMVANQYNGSSYLINSYLYKWMSGSSCFGNGTSCASATLGANAFQTIGTAGGRDWQTFTIGTDIYAMVANIQNNSTVLINSYLYKWISGSSCFGDGTTCASSTLGANSVQTIGTAGARCWQDFSVGTDTYVLVANQYNGTSYLLNSYLYKWKDTGFGTDNYPTTPYYVTTASGSQLNTSSWGVMTGVTMTQTTPTNTNLKYLVSFDNQSTWKYWNGSAWTASTLGNIATNGMTKTTIEAITQAQWSASGGFTAGTLDFAANLSTTDLNFTPSLDNIAVNYNLPQTQTLTSSAYNTELSPANLSKIQWTENLPANTDIKFQLGTSPDGNTWTWCGPDDATPGSCTNTTYFTGPTGTETIDETQRDRANDQYFQYKAFLVSTDGVSTPTLSDVSVSYDTVINPTVTTQAVSDISTVTATGNGTVTDAGGENPTRYIEWGVTSGVYTSSCSAGTGGTGSYSCGLTSLSPGATYYVRAKAVNSSGSSYGSEVSFSASIAVPTVTTSAVSGISITTAIGNGNIAATGGENPTRYIEWGTSPGIYTMGSCNAGIGGTGAYSCNITGLSSDVTYYVRAKAVNSAGTSYGDETSFTTGRNVVKEKGAVKFKGNVKMK
jgi:hypothetical protein